MSGKGGESEELKDFEANSSAADEEARARVELAESGLIDQAIAERNGAHVEHVYKAPSKARLAIMTIFGSLLGACFIFLVVLLAMRVGSSNFFKDTQKNKENVGTNEVFLLSYNYASKLYGLGDKTPKTEGSYLLEDYGIKDNSDYTVITRMTQLQKLQASFVKISGEEANFAEELGINDDFFDSGSVIAVAIEDPYIASLQPTKVSRDESYGLEIRLYRTNLEAEVTPPLAGYLNLIKVENVQPREITLFIENN